MSQDQRQKARRMRIVAGPVVAVLCAVALATLAAASVGCGGKGGEDKVQPQWERVTSAQVPGDRPAKVYLGTYRLGERLRLAWVLSGPENRR